MKRTARISLIVVLVLTVGSLIMACGLCDWSVDPPETNKVQSHISTATARMATQESIGASRTEWAVENK